MKNPFKFLEEARSEIRKIVWPTRNETFITTIMVLVMVILLTLFFMAVDAVISLGLGGLIGIFS